MAIIKTMKLSDLMTWGSWINKNESIRYIPNPEDINASYKKLKKQLEKVTESIRKYITGNVINHGQPGNDNSFVLDTDIRMSGDTIEHIIVTNDRNVLISVAGYMWYKSLSDYDMDSQIKIMNSVEKIVTKKSNNLKN